MTTLPWPRHRQRRSGIQGRKADSAPQSHQRGTTKVTEKRSGIRGRKGECGSTIPPTVVPRMSVGSSSCVLAHLLPTSRLEAAPSTSLRMAKRHLIALRVRPVEPGAPLEHLKAGPQWLVLILRSYVSHPSHPVPRVLKAMRIRSSRFGLSRRTSFRRSAPET